MPKNKEISVAKVADNFEWVPAEALGGVDQTESGAEQIIPKITITKTPKPTADPAKYTREYVIELEKFHISNTGTRAADTSQGLNAALQHAKTT